MMAPRSPWTLIGIGCVLVILGAVLPLLMVLRVVPSTFFLNFFAYAASIAGLFLGIWGAALYVIQSRRH